MEEFINRFVFVDRILVEETLKRSKKRIYMVSWWFLSCKSARVQFTERICSYYCLSIVIISPSRPFPHHHSKTKFIQIMRAYLIIHCVDQCLLQQAWRNYRSHRLSLNINWVSTFQWFSFFLIQPSFSSPPSFRS